jgi:hypothetical protein
MRTQATVIATLSLMAWLGSDAQSEGFAADIANGANRVTMTIVEVKVREKALEVHFQIINGLKEDIWVCDAMDSVQWGAPDFEAVPSEDGRTFIMRKRTGLPWDVMRDPPLARYVRLKAGKSLSGSLVIPLPAQSQTVVSSTRVPSGGGHIQRIMLEIGYYQEDLPAMILDAPETRESSEQANEEGRILRLVHFNAINEYTRSSNMEVLFYADESDPIVESELLLQTAVDSRPISYKVTPKRRQSAPDLHPCNRIEITYEPSALEYFFPYEDQRCLLSPAEMSRLQSLHKVVVDNDADVKEFMYQVSTGVFQGITARPAKAHVICYEGRDRVAALDVYRDCFLTEAGEPFSFGDAGYSGKFRRLASEMLPYELRVACGNNLRVLHDRFYLYPEVRALRIGRSRPRGELRYPAATEWCDMIVAAFKSKAASARDQRINRPFICPSVGDDKCAYAMNDNWRRDSPPDTVLLFEAKAGWNQHGGPELFTLDNHNPRGGLVLFNDGTVTFIRTEEELKQLRWK